LKPWFRRSIALWLLLGSFPAWAGAKWTEPTQEELKMTADPAAPGAAAMYLYFEQTVDDIKHEHTFYARIKILTEDGKQYADVTMSYFAKEEKIRGVEGRTIHADGTVVPFTGKPWEKELVKAGGVRVMEKGFSMPDPQVGSILEFRYMTTYDDWWAPKWYIQHPIPMREAHYHFYPGEGGQLVATHYLPATAVINEKKGWDLVMHDVPAIVDEEDSPPMHSLGYRALFYYVPQGINSPEEFWQQNGKFWASAVDYFAAPDAFRPVVAQLVASGDTDEQKLRKIYAAVMTLENTDFTREHSEAEEKAEHLKVKTAADVWAQKRGNEPGIALVFLGMARASGVKAYAMKVTSRDEDVFQKGHLDWDLLDDTIVIANVGGKEMYFDPGERYCEFGKLHWKHTWTSGIRQTVDGGVALASTPFPVSSDTVVTRSADLVLDAEGNVKGSVRVSMTGNTALHWRQEALATDEDEANKRLRESLQSVLPEGATLEIQNITGWADFGVPLQATLKVSGRIGTKTGHRFFLPGTFFEAQAKPRFATATRANPVYLPYAYTIEDHVKLTLPADATVEALPGDDAEIPFSPNGEYHAHYSTAGHVYEGNRKEVVGVMLYQTTVYPALRDFFQKMNAQDQAQLVLKLAAEPAGSAATASAISH
jgi:hypothetical protein